MTARTRRRRPVASPGEGTCGVQEQPVGYHCTRAKGHRGDHACVGGEGETIAKWDSRAEWHGPVLHGVKTPLSTLTLCGERAGTVKHPITYESRLVRCKACLAVLTPSEKVRQLRKGKK